MSGSLPESAYAKRCGRTAANIEGPFYKEGAPTRDDLREKGATGSEILLTGYVYDRKCNPIEGALIDVWHADHSGSYDNKGVLFRGKQITGENGRFSVRSIRPGHYKVGRGFRPSHLHFKVSAAGSRSLTTQLYFPDDPYNEKDQFFDSSLLVSHRPFNGCSMPPTYQEFGYDFAL